MTLWRDLTLVGDCTCENVEKRRVKSIQDHIHILYHLARGVGEIPMLCEVRCGVLLSRVGYILSPGNGGEAELIQPSAHDLDGAAAVVWGG